MFRVRKQRAQASSNAFFGFRLAELGFEPPKGLNNAHRGPSSPVEPRRRRLPEGDWKIAQLDWFEPHVRMDDDTTRDGIAEPQVVSCRHSVYKDARLLTASHSFDEGAIICC
jgi:hypothetical protein